MARPVGSAALIRFRAVVASANEMGGDADPTASFTQPGYPLQERLKLGASLWE